MFTDLTRYIDVGRPDKKQGQLSDLYGALNIGQSIIFVNSRPDRAHISYRAATSTHPEVWGYVSYVKLNTVMAPSDPVDVQAGSLRPSQDHEGRGPCRQGS